MPAVLSSRLLVYQLEGGIPMPDIERQHLSAVKAAFDRDGKIPALSRGILEAAYRQASANPDDHDPNFIKQLA